MVAIIARTDRNASSLVETWSGLRPRTSQERGCPQHCLSEADRTVPLCPPDALWIASQGSIFRWWTIFAMHWLERRRTALSLVQFQPSPWRRRLRCSSDSPGEGAVETRSRQEPARRACPGDRGEERATRKRLLKVGRRDRNASSSSGWLEVDQVCAVAREKGGRSDSGGVKEEEKEIDARPIGGRGLMKLCRGCVARPPSAAPVSCRRSVRFPDAEVASGRQHNRKQQRLFPVAKVALWRLLYRISKRCPERLPRLPVVSRRSLQISLLLGNIAPPFRLLSKKVSSTFTREGD